MKCPKCGIYTSEKYCPDCGIRLAPRRKKPKQSKGVTVTKLVIGIFSIILFVLVMLQACAVTSIGVFVSEETAAGGLIGVMVAFLMLAAGIVGITTRTKPRGGLVASAMWFIAAFMGFAASSVYGDMSVWGFLALVFGIVYFVSTFLSFYKRSFYRKWWFYALAVLMIIAVLGMIVRNDRYIEEPVSEPTLESNVVEMPNAALPSISEESTEQTTVAEQPGVFEINDFKVTYVSHSVVTDTWDDSTCLDVVFEFEHYKDNTISYNALAFCQAFQGGIELEKTYYTNDSCEEMYTEVMANTPIKVNDTFKLRNTEDPVVIEMTEFISFGDAKMEMTLNLK